MSKAIDKYLPLHDRDLADTGHFGPAEFGALILLWRAYWPVGAIPSAPGDLARIARMSAKEWALISVRVLKGFTLEGEIYRHVRLDDLRCDAQVKYERRASAAYEMHKRRRGKAGALHDALQPDGTSKARAKRVNLSSPSEKERARAAARSNAAPPAANEPGWERDYPRWAEYRKEIGDSEWHHRFAKARPNGSETTLIVGSAIEASRILDACGQRLAAHFGEPVTVKVQPATPKETAQ